MLIIERSIENTVLSLSVLYHATAGHQTRDTCADAEGNIFRFIPLCSLLIILLSFSKLHKKSAYDKAETSDLLFDKQLINWRKKYATHQTLSKKSPLFNDLFSA